MRTRAVLAALAVLVGTLAMALVPGGASARTSVLEGVPQFDHVVVLVEENENAATTWAPSTPDPYLKGLRGKGVFLPNYYGTGHVSLDNYVAMVSGQPGNGLTNSDCLAVNLYKCAQTTLAFGNGRHFGDQLDEKGVTWRSYMDSTPTPCFHGPYSATDPSPTDPYQGNSQTPPAKDYADRHNPFIYFPNFVGDDARCAKHQRPYTELAGDLARDTLPQFSFITPDTCHDGHDGTCSNGAPGGLVSADAWLKSTAPSLLGYLSTHNGLLVINFDESDPTGPGSASDDSCQSCASLGAGGRVGAILISPRLPQGATVTTGYDHYSLLRTLEDSFGITEYLNLAAQAAPMTDAFKQTAPASGPATAIPSPSESLSATVPGTPEPSFLGTFPSGDGSLIGSGPTETAVPAPSATNPAPSVAGGTTAAYLPAADIRTLPGLLPVIAMVLIGIALALPVAAGHARRNPGGTPMSSSSRRWRLILAVASLAFAVIIAIFGWYKAANEQNANRQIPYFASAGMAVVVLAAVGGSLLVAEQLRGDDRRLEELEGAVRTLAIALSPQIESPPRIGAVAIVEATEPETE